MAQNLDPLDLPLQLAPYITGIIDASAAIAFASFTRIIGQSGLTAAQVSPPTDKEEARYLAAAAICIEDAGSPQKRRLLNYLCNYTRGGNENLERAIFRINEGD